MLVLGGLSHPLQAGLPEADTLRGWIQEMKASSKGPFYRIRWFCKDGSILPPEPYACREHDGGVQHGEWSERTKQLRAGGYKIANVLADLDAEAFKSEPDYLETFNQILLEQFLIAVDDGWILRKARFYRGALQAEGELRGGRRLLLSLAGEPHWSTKRFLPLRVGARLLSHGRETASVSDVRQHSLALSEKDEGFVSLRNKIHVRPDRKDAERVRKYAKKVSDPTLAAELERLAASIDKVYTSESLVRTLKTLARHLREHPRLARVLREGATTLASTQDPRRRFTVSSELMVVLRDYLPKIRQAHLRLATLDASLALEVEHFAVATVLREQLPRASRRERLNWLQASADAVYGAGLISARELSALGGTFAELEGSEVLLSAYKAGLDYLALVPGWSGQWLRFQFYRSMQKLGHIEPSASRFIQDLLRGSPVFFYATVLDSLVNDANRLAGVRRVLFGEEMGSGLRSLNPGLARGTLRLCPQESAKNFESDGIYLLPETIAELPPVAGILTADEGNPLSHVQLLARNLGIPNVSINESVIPKLALLEGTKVILAVSPAGSVRLLEDRGQWDVLFGEEKTAAQILIRPDLQKLDLKTRAFIPLSKLRASDSGRIVGPKAAKLGELYHHYPETVAEGLAIPFGVFRALLDQPVPGEDQTVFQWIVDQYAALRAMTSASRRAATEAFRKRLEALILNADPGEAFRQRLRRAMEKVFGEDGAYGVFVRSDTNVEDLPGFTGAGLNLTVPHVVGFENVLAAISRVWASPFSRRAFAWRQSYMEQPEHVYPAVLLMRSVPSEKSGVMVTQDIDTGEAGWLSVAVNEGVGGAVDGQASESLRIHTQNGQVRLLSQATAPLRRVLKPEGGITLVPVSGAEALLNTHEMNQLIQLARELPQRFPAITDAAGNPAPADIEFGFLGGRLMLFQIRPFLESARAQDSDFLNALDRGLNDQLNATISLSAVPTETAL